MGRQIVRPACKDDARALADVKGRYVRALYRGMLSADYLKGIHETFYLDQIQRWLDGEYQVDVLEEDGAVTGFITYGADPEDNRCGLIYEVGIMPTCSWMEKDALMNSCLRSLAGQYQLVRVMTVRDNLRARFLYEQFGFRPDGSQRIEIIDGNELRIIGLIGRTGPASQGE